MREVKRPWGLFKRFVLNEKCTVKVLIINPDSELSLQAHKKRDELWYFFSNAVVQIGKKKIRIKPEGIVKIKRGIKHRIIAGEKKVILMEISKGNFDEKDEIKFEDKYNRK